MKKILFIMLITLLSLVLIACASVANNAQNSNELDAVPGELDTVPDKLDAVPDELEPIPEKVDLPWPKDKLPKSVPQLKGIRITEIADIEGGILITFEGCNSDETKLYINKLKNAGWDYKTKNDENGKTVTASTPNETLIFISSPDTQAGSIAYSTN